MSEYRTETDSMGPIRVPADRYYGAQTARSLVHFAIGSDTMPDAVIRAFGTLKYSRSISSQEVINLSSAVRFGVALQMEGLATVRVLNEILIRAQPAHIQLAAGREMEQRERNVIRANYVRKLLGDGTETAVHPN